MKIKYNGVLTECERVKVVQQEERTSDYLLEDETMLHVKCVLTGVFRFKDLQDDNGQPIYHANWHVIPSTEPK